MPQKGQVGFEHRGNARTYIPFVDALRMFLAVPKRPGWLRLASAAKLPPPQRPLYGAALPTVKLHGFMAAKIRTESRIKWQSMPTHVSKI